MVADFIRSASGGYGLPGAIYFFSGCGTSGTSSSMALALVAVASTAAANSGVMVPPGPPASANSFCNVSISASRESVSLLTLARVSLVLINESVASCIVIGICLVFLLGLLLCLGRDIWDFQINT